MKRNQISICIFITTVILLIVYKPHPSSLSIHVTNYFVDAVFLLLSETLLLIKYSKNQLDVFEPLTIVSFFYLCMFYVAPIHDIHNGLFTWYGYSLFEFGPLTSFFVFLGFLSFYIFYTIIKVPKNYTTNHPIIKTLNVSRLRRFSLIVYGICFLANVYYMQRVGGNSLLYMLTLGIAGSSNTIETTDAALGFISMLSYCLPTATLLYWEYSNSIKIKTLLFIPMLMLQVARGFRFFVIQIAITFISYIFLKKGSRPNVKTIVACVIAFMIPVLIMTTFRNSIRDGEGIDTSIINSELAEESFEAAVWENFRIYQNVYGMVGVIPAKYPYCYFDEIIIGTAVMFIPRIIWPDKPSMYGGEGLSELIGSNIGSGQAYPSLGEFYYSLGILGIIIYMGIYGWWMGRVRKRYMKEGTGADGLDIIVFSVLLGTNLQLIIRGYMPSNFWYVVFAVLPVYIIRKIRHIKTL